MKWVIRVLAGVGIAGILIARFREGLPAPGFVAAIGVILIGVGIFERKDLSSFWGGDDDDHGGPYSPA
jgi:hypothetical protein